MAPHHSVQKRSFFFLKFIRKPVVTWNPRGNYQTISASTYSYQKQGGIKYKVKKFYQHGTVRNWHKETCCRQRRARDRANIAAAVGQRQTLTAPIVIGMRCPTLYVHYFLSRRRKSKQGFHRFSILSRHSSTKRDVMMILSKH